MADVIYKVSVELGTKGSLSGDLGGGMSKASALDGALNKAKSSAVNLGSTIAGVGSTIAGAFTGAVEKVGSLALGLGKLAVLGAAGGLAYGIVGLNNELEKSQISLAAIFGANSLSKDMNHGMDMAADTMEKMRRDAAALPGEFKDLLGIFKDVSVPGFQAGASIAELQKFSSKAMATSAVLGLPMEQAGRELAMLLEGRAGAHNVLGMRLAGLGGKKAQEFNKKSAPERFKELSSELDKFAPSIDRFAKSFEGASSTFRDNVKKLGADVTKPLFGAITRDLLSANSWFDANDDKTRAFTEHLGQGIVSAYETGKQKIDEWTPAVKTFAANARAEIKSIWSDVEPIIGRLATGTKNFLASPDAMNKLEGVAEAYAAIKIGGPLLGGLAQFAGPAMAAGGIAALPEIAIAAASIAAIGLAVGGAVAAIETPGDASSATPSMAADMWRDAKANMSSTWLSLQPVKDSASAAAEALGTVLVGAVNAASWALSGIGAALGGAFAFLQNAGDFLQGWDASDYPLNPANPHDYLPPEREFHLGGFQGTAADFGGEIGAGFVKKYEGFAYKEREKKKPMGGGGGGGGVHIDKVEITVTQNNEPSRVARIVGGHLADLSRFKKASPDVMNYSASR